MITKEVVALQSKSFSCNLPDGKYRKVFIRSGEELELALKNNHKVFQELFQRDDGSTCLITYILVPVEHIFAKQ